MPRASSGGDGTSRGLGAKTMSKTLYHRGSNDVGLVLGRTGDEVYVPRALWTETFDSPMKQRSEYDPRAHTEDVQRHKQRHASMQQIVVQELDRQVRQKEFAKQSMLEETLNVARTHKADEFQVRQNEALVNEVREDNRKTFRSGLDAALEDNRRRERQTQARAAREAVEMKLRTLKQLQDEVAEMDRRKEAAKRDALAGQLQHEAKKEQQQIDKQREMQEARHRLQEDAMRAEWQVQAQQERLQEAQRRQDVNYQTFKDTAQLQDKMRRTREEKRLDESVQLHQTLVNSHYDRREAARSRQRKKVAEALQEQVRIRQRDKGLQDIQKQMERDAVVESTTLSFEQDFQKLHDKRVQELQHQSELVQMMAEKQSRAKSEGRRLNPSVLTMEVTPGMVADIRSRASLIPGKSASAPDLHQRVDAAKFLQKPCGRPEVPEAKSWEDLSRSHGLGGLAGCFGGEGGTMSSLKSLGGKGHMLAGTLKLAARDERAERERVWNAGLTAEDLKGGRRAAARRMAKSAMDKGDGPLPKQKKPGEA